MLNSLVDEINDIISNEVFDDIRARELLSFTDVNNILTIFKNLLAFIRLKKDDPDTQWLFQIIVGQIKDIKRYFSILSSSIDENKKDPKIKWIGVDDGKRDFSQFSNDILVKVIYLDNLFNHLSMLQDYLELESQKLALNANNLLTEKINVAIKDLEKEVADFRRLRNIADNAKTEDIFNHAVLKYNGLETKYRDYFYKSIVIVSSLAFLLFLLKAGIQSIWGLSEVEFWYLKISILVVGITVISYFLKQSSHYQMLADQNYQTQVELQAYPSYMESIPLQEAASVRKELALKYFGREIDGAVHKDMSSLIADQMKSTTEMVKASTEAIKNLKG